MTLTTAATKKNRLHGIVANKIFNGRNGWRCCTIYRKNVVHVSVKLFVLKTKEVVLLIHIYDDILLVLAGRKHIAGGNMKNNNKY